MANKAFLHIQRCKLEESMPQREIVVFELPNGNELDDKTPL